MKISIRKKSWGNILVAGFIGLLFLKDFLSISIPSMVFMGVWILILLFAEKETAAAFTLSSVICFASTLSITIPCAVYIVFTILSKKRLRFNAIVVVSLYVVFVELMRLIAGTGEDFRQYVNSMTVLLLVMVVIMELYDKTASPQRCIKYYLAFFGFMSLDIIWATAKSLGGIGSIINGNFRIGQVEMIDETVEGIFSVNANGIALMAMLAVSSIILLLSKKYLTLKIAIPMLAYFTLVGLLTISKTFILVYVGFWCLYVCWYTKKSGANIFKPLALIVILGIAVAVLWNTDVIQNILARFDTYDITTGRIDVTYEYLDYMSKNTLGSIFGIGLQNVTGKVSMLHVPHNAILEIFVCFGVVGLALYLLFFVTLFRMSARYKIFEGKERHIFINYLPFVTFIVFIQSLQFLRINYIYASIAIVFACMLLRPFPTQMKISKEKAL